MTPGGSAIPKALELPNNQELRSSREIAVPNIMSVRKVLIASLSWVKDILSKQVNLLKDGKVYQYIAKDRVKTLNKRRPGHQKVDY